MGMGGVTMIDILVDAQFQLGMVVMVLIFLVLVTAIHAFTRSPAPPPRPQQWQVVEPAEQLPTVVAKRIEVK